MIAQHGSKQTIRGFCQSSNALVQVHTGSCNPAVGTMYAAVSCTRYAAYCVRCRSSQCICSGMCGALQMGQRAIHSENLQIMSLGLCMRCDAKAYALRLASTQSSLHPLQSSATRKGLSSFQEASLGCKADQLSLPPQISHKHSSAVRGSSDLQAIIVTRRQLII